MSYCWFLPLSLATPLLLAAVVLVPVLGWQWGLAQAASQSGTSSQAVAVVATMAVAATAAAVQALPSEAMPPPLRSRLACLED